MKNTRIEEIKKSATITANVLNVIRIITMVAAIIALVSGIICLLCQNKVDGSVIYDGGTFRVLPPVSQEAMINGEGFDFINNLNIENFMVWAALNCFMAATIVAIVTVVIVLIRKVFVELRDNDTPFTENVRNQLKITGILVTICALMESLAIAAIIGLSFWCLYCVFGYGMELQKNDDETL